MRLRLFDVAGFIEEERYFIDGDVHEAGIRIERHRVPVMRPGGARNHSVQSKIHCVFNQYRSTFLIKLPSGPVLIGKGCRRDQFTVSGVENIKETILRRLHDNAAIDAVLSQWEVSQHDLLRRRVVPAVPGGRLVMPSIFSRIGIDRQDGR